MQGFRMGGNTVAHLLAQNAQVDRLASARIRLQ